MGATGRTESPGLESSDQPDLLHTEPYRFEFFQAVRLLERMAADAEAVGGYGDPSGEAVRFGVHNSTTFPASEIQALEFRKDQPPRMSVNFLGLTGPLGVLPLQYTEFVKERLRARDHTLRDFLDIFHHRLLSLFYLAWQKYRSPVTFERGDDDQFRSQLFSFLGLGTPGLRDRQDIADEAMLFDGGLLLMHTRPAIALEDALRDYFGVPVEIEQFVGAWYPVAEDAQCNLGEDSFSGSLGRGTVVGHEVWDAQSKIRVKIGPLTLEQYETFVPGGGGYQQLRAWVKFFAGLECGVEVQLILRREDVPSCRMGASASEGPRLGWTTWAKSKDFTRDPDETVFELI